MTKNRELPVIQDGVEAKGRLTRREMVQRLLMGAGAGATWQLVAGSHPMYAHLANGVVFEEAEKLGTADWKPAFFNAQQDETLIALAEAIVPGSGKAQVNRFIDLLLNVDTVEHKKKFVESLAAFEAESQKRFGKGFASVEAGQQNGLLTDASAGSATENSAVGDRADGSNLHAHFENLKGWISGAYYSSEAGMRELRWTGDYVFASFPGCEHPEGHS
jgi:hypothetical protein